MHPLHPPPRSAPAAAHEQQAKHSLCWKAHFTAVSLACEQALRGAMTAGRGKERELAFTASLEFEYRKIPKISPGAYIFQRPFLRGLFLEGLVFGALLSKCVSSALFNHSFQVTKKIMIFH